jgi:hypothetical protein
MLLNNAIAMIPAKLLPMVARGDETRFGGVPGGLLAIC